MIGKNTIGQPWIMGSLLCGALGISACVAARPPVTSVSHTEVIVRSDPPYTPVELQLAREKLDAARLALDAYEYERARLLAEQALADAQLAEVRAPFESTRQTARDLRLRIEILRDEAARASTTTVYLPPSSPIELRLAMEELDRARLALNMRDYERAHRLSEQALADAQLAELRAESENSRRIARGLRLSSEALRNEAARVAITSFPPYPPVELRLAMEEFDRARLALSMRDYARARLLADQALADARLAEVRAGSESTRLAARDLALSIETLRTEATRLAALY
jgi:hypothetical protein